MEHILLPNGALLQEQYKVKKHLLSLPQGELYLVFDQKITETNWLLLEYNRGLQQKEDNDLLTLGEVLADFSHPKLGKSRGCFIESGRFYTVWEELAGLTLEQYVTMNTNPISEEQGLQWVLEIVELLKSMHELPQSVTILDIPLSSVFFTVTSELKLTAIPIEIISNSDSAKTRQLVNMEVNAIGRILYLMLTRKIWSNDSINISKANPKIGPHIEEFIQRSLGLKLPCFHKLEELEKEINELIKTIQIMAVPKRTPWDEWEEEKRSKPKGDRYWGIIRHKKEFEISLPAVFIFILFSLFGGSFLFHYLFPAPPPSMPLPKPGNRATMQHDVTIKQKATIYPMLHQSSPAAQIQQGGIPGKKAETSSVVKTEKEEISPFEERKVSTQDPFVDLTPKWTPPPGFNEKEKTSQNEDIENI